MVNEYMFVYTEYEINIDLKVKWTNIDMSIFVENYTFK